MGVIEKLIYGKAISIDLLKIVLIDRIDTLNRITEQDPPFNNKVHVESLKEGHYKIFLLGGYWEWILNDDTGKRTSMRKQVIFDFQTYHAPRHGLITDSEIGALAEYFFDV